LKLLDKLQNPINFDKLTTIKIRSEEPMDYLYHLYLCEQSQKTLLNNRVFHEIKDKGMIALFTVFPPKIGVYTLEVRVYTFLHIKYSYLRVSLSFILTLTPF